MRLVSRRFIVLACTVVLTGGIAAGCFPQTEVRWQHTPVRGYSELWPEQLAEYVAAIYWISGGEVGGCGTTAPYRAAVPVGTLARYFVDEGNAQNIRGDIAFAQSILETGWFSFPDCGQVRPWYNNFGGIGETDGGSGTPGQFPTAQIGVRAQIQRLNRYANPAGAESLAQPLVPQRGWSTASQYTNSWIHGQFPTWQSLTGTWATSPCYDYRVLKIYNQMRTHYGLAPMPVAGSATC